MSASLKHDIREEVRRELDAMFTVIRALSESLTTLEARLKALEAKNHGNRQRRTAGSN